MLLVEEAIEIRETLTMSIEILGMSPRVDFHMLRYSNRGSGFGFTLCRESWAGAKIGPILFRG